MTKRNKILLILQLLTTDFKLNSLLKLGWKNSFRTNFAKVFYELFIGNTSQRFMTERVQTTL